MAVENNDVVRITCKFSFLSNDVQNVYHMKVSTTGPVDDEDFLDEVAADMDSMYDDITTHISNDVAFESVEVYNVTDESYIGEVAWPSKTVGGASGNNLPPAASALCLFSTGFLRSQGRKFLPLMTLNALTTNGGVHNDVVTAITSFIADVLLAKSGVNWSGLMGNWNPDLARFAQWIAGIAQDEWATQRRRYKGSGS